MDLGDFAELMMSDFDEIDFNPEEVSGVFFDKLNALDQEFEALDAEYVSTIL